MSFSVVSTKMINNLWRCFLYNVGNDLLSNSCSFNSSAFFVKFKDGSSWDTDRHWMACDKILAYRICLSVNGPLTFFTRTWDSSTEGGNKILLATLWSNFSVVEDWRFNCFTWCNCSSFQAQAGQHFFSKSGASLLKFSSPDIKVHRVISFVVIRDDWNCGV